MFLRYLVLFLCLRLVQCAPEVTIGGTTLVGLAASQLEFFGGIPFAEPPVGSLRFAPPVKLQSTSETSFDASKYGAACLQSSATSSEDCLTINVLRPAGLDAATPVPVMAWVYGGGFVSGSASQFDASPIVAQSVSRGTPIIYVNFNYRVSLLGFPQGNEAAAQGALNLGLKDALLALEWIQDNIGSFGGDKTKVTVFGESAGAILLSQLFLNSSFGDLARAAIFQSGAAGSGFLFNASRRESDWQNFAAAVPNCAGAASGATFECLRAASSSAILDAMLVAEAAATDEFPFIPVIDGPGGLIPDLPSRLLSQGQFAHLPFISGNCQDEGTDFVPVTFSSGSQLNAWIIANNTPSDVPLEELGLVGTELLFLYPDDPTLGCPFGTGDDTFGLSSSFKRAAALVGDVAFHSQRRAWQQAATSQGVTTYGYLLTDPQPNNFPYLGVTHGSDIPYVYGNLGNATPASESLSRNMIDYWISFATSLTPNDAHGNSSRAKWPSYSLESKEILELNGQLTQSIQDNFRGLQMDFINSVPIVLRH